MGFLAKGSGDVRVSLRCAIERRVLFSSAWLARAAGNSLSLFLSYIIPEQQIDTPPCPDSQEQEWPKKSDKIQGWVVIGHNMGRDDILSNTIQHNPNSWEGPAPDHLPDPSPDSLNGQSLHSVVSRCPQPSMIQWTHGPVDPSKPPSRCIPGHKQRPSASACFPPRQRGLWPVNSAIPMESPELKSPAAKGPDNAADVEAAPSSVHIDQALDSPTSKSKEAISLSITAAPLQGFRLYTVAVGVYFGALMMSLDLAIIGTVRTSQCLQPAPPKRQDCQQIYGG